MTRAETLKFLAIIKVAYPMAYKDMDEESKIATVKMWQSTFSGTPYAVMSMALDHFRKISSFPPTVADMYKEMKGLYYTAVSGFHTAASKAERERYRCLMDYTNKFRGDYVEHEINLKTLAELPELSDYQKSLSGGDQDNGKV